MSKQPYYTVIMDDTQAEGSAFANESEPYNSATLTQSLVAVKPESFPASSYQAEMRHPNAETGLLARVSLTPEGVDRSERQDAGRTVAETNAITAQQPVVEAPRKLTALIVEDTTELAEVVEATLRRMNMLTVHESHGNRAFERFVELMPDILLLDLGLPDITGWKVLDNIKERAKAGDARLPVVIVITAMDDPANRVVGKLHGVRSYLIKPFTVGQLEKAVKAALGLDAGTSP